MAVANKYREGNMAHLFVIDLLKLHKHSVKNLLALKQGEDESAGRDVQESFQENLQNFITNHSLQNALLNQISTIMVGDEVRVLRHT
jgi:hypothetical protein